MKLALILSVIFTAVCTGYSFTLVAPEPVIPESGAAAPVFGFSYDEEWGPFSQASPTGELGGVHYVEFSVPKHNPDLGTLTRVVVRMQTAASYTPKLGCGFGSCSGGGHINYHWDAWVARAVVQHPSLAMVSNSIEANWDITTGASAPADSCSPNYTNAWTGSLQGDDSGVEHGAEYTDQNTLDLFTGKEEEITMRVWWPQTFNSGTSGMNCVTYDDGWAVSEGAVEYTYDP